jgi:hypothetical protein
MKQGIIDLPDIPRLTDRRRVSRRLSNQRWMRMAAACGTSSKYEEKPARLKIIKVYVYEIHN